MCNHNYQYHHSHPFLYHDHDHHSWRWQLWFCGRRCDPHTEVRFWHQSITANILPSLPPSPSPSASPSPSSIITFSSSSLDLKSNHSECLSQISRSPPRGPSHVISEFQVFLTWAFLQFKSNHSIIPFCQTVTRRKFAPSSRAVWAPALTAPTSVSWPVTFSRAASCSASDQTSSESPQRDAQLWPDSGQGLLQGRGLRAEAPWPGVLSQEGQTVRLSGGGELRPCSLLGCRTEK